MCNDKIRLQLKEQKIFLWQLAEEIGIHESTLIKRLRKKLPEEQEKQILLAIESIKKHRTEKTQVIREKQPVSELMLFEEFDI